MSIPEGLIYRLLATPTQVEGNHQNAVWRGLVGPVRGNETGVPMFIKHLLTQQALATELACGIAAQTFGLPVPDPALVICDVSDLSGMGGRPVGAELICFGSRMQFEDPVFGRQRGHDASAEEFVWARICGTPTGATGAAWDELVANRDRHTENVVYDGVKWWLLDHELALEPLAQVMARFADAVVHQEIIDYRAPENRLANQMLTRRPADHGLRSQPRRFAAGVKRLAVTMEQMRNWSTGDSRIDPILQLAEIIVRSIHARLPALALHLDARIGARDAKSLWNS